MSGDSNTVQLIRVLLADDHDILRQGLKLLLAAQPDIEVVGEARTGKEAIEQAQELQPDIIVMDISMAEMDGMEACQHIRMQHPNIQVLMLTMHESEEYFLQSLRMGAAGYIVKKAAPADLCMAVRTTAHGGAFLYPGLARALIRAYLTPQMPTNPALSSSTLNTPLDVLTPREREVLILVAEGRTNQEIANQLVISIKTVQAHRANMMEKLGLQDITQLVRFAIAHGLITSEF
ncbi:DNA-binding response regulator [Reticulibacter mediterranei]|uniref:DNA-binding response regulator n=1 Tax=Reticulibacter mediterranei TaxID=2778369 RepID=A0A8J3IPC8_9CHLR|nr:response regulator transcription factor [Reticulibacter mediterranei]GHO96103.1 DNA-binding response regulator [Reticulibacter mediterranei]